MPSIEITAEQAQALARGQNITIAPKPTYQLGIGRNGGVRLVRRTGDKIESRLLVYSDTDKPVLDTVWESFPLHWYTVTSLPDNVTKPAR